MAVGLCLSCIATGTAGADAGPPALFTGSLERHHTTNALDSDRPLADWYTLLRGSLQRRFGDADASLTLGADFEATRHDRVVIEDDRTLGLSLTAFRRLEAGLELKGTLSYRLTSDGDDLAIGPLSIGMRTLKKVIAGHGQIGIDLGNATTLIVEAGDGLEKSGPTRFERGILPDSRLDPDTNRLQVAARLTRTVGRLAFGASAAALGTAVERLGVPPAGVSFEQYGIRAEAAYAGAGGTTLAVALGGELLDAADGLYRRVRPAWQLTFAKPLGHGFDLRGSYFGRYESADSDDPLASWLRRAELEGTLTLRPDLAFAAGLFCDVKDNLLFENEERSRGFFAEVTYRMTPSTSFVLRVDATRTYKTVIDVRESTVDTFVGLRARM